MSSFVSDWGKQLQKHREMLETVGNEAVSNVHVFEWFKIFR
jgi:hypothetical protein